ncbi:MAG: glycosyltransferase [Ferruginibacter sp.]|nr:glycosyltransferase [Ferruginibacter sp.]
MHILIVNNSVIPALKYGGTERVIWWLGKMLVKMGHKVSYLVAKGSYCPFADVYELNHAVAFNSQVPASVDIVHLLSGNNEKPVKPYIITMQGNLNEAADLDSNTVFVSRNHAGRYGSDSFVYNCLDVEDYGKPDLTSKRHYVHFLADAAWRVKNVSAAIKIAREASVPLQVIGGVRFNFNMGIRLTFDPNTRFRGMKGGEEKNTIINGSKGLLFPVLWNEPFGIAIVESLYFGCPVIGTPYGSLTELVPAEVGFLSAKKDELVNAVKNIDVYDRTVCHRYVMDNFTADKMTFQYLALYEKVMNGEHLNAIAPKLKKVQQEKFLPFD